MGKFSPLKFSMLKCVIYEENFVIKCQFCEIYKEDIIQHDTILNYRKWLNGNGKQNQFQNI
jgi:hypothetical protein